MMIINVDNILVKKYRIICQVNINPKYAFSNNNIKNQVLMENDILKAAALILGKKEN